jgi:ribosomal protein L37AE/L43A
VCKDVNERGSWLKMKYGPPPPNLDKVLAANAESHQWEITEAGTVEGDEMMWKCSVCRINGMGGATEPPVIAWDSCSERLMKEALR